jgi:hypothetical protein
MGTQPNEKLNRLQAYADSIKQRLHGAIPEKHAKSEGSKAAFKQMLEIDLRKTMDQINKLKGV